MVQLSCTVLDRLGYDDFLYIYNALNFNLIHMTADGAIVDDTNGLSSNKRLGNFGNGMSIKLANRLSSWTRFTWLGRPLELIVVEVSEYG